MVFGRDQNGRAHTVHDASIPSIDETLNSRYFQIMATIGVEPIQLATLNRLQVQGDTLAVRDGLADLRYNTQPTVIAREMGALTHPDLIRSSMASYQGPPQVAVQPKPFAWDP